MAKSMYVNVINEEESRIAIVDEGVLEELSIETSHDELIEGNIYKAKVEKVIPGLDAVFVDFGREKNGFIALGEIRSEYFSGDRRPENLKRGRELLVQVKKGEIGNKGAALTSYISIPGRYLVLMPYVDKRGVSRQIEDDEKRKHLRDAIAETSLPDGMGYIVRTAAEDQKKQDIQRDVMYLLRMWKRISTMFEKAKQPGLLYREGDIVIRTIRDYFYPEMKELLVDDPKVHEKVAAFFKAVMPWHAKKVKLYDGRAPLFTKHNLEAQIATIQEEKVKLPSGGSIVIQQTEALVSVDVNSGAGSKNKDIEATALQTNMEAASEVARQLRLRDLGGLIVVDFIDMRSHGNQSSVKKELQRALKDDKAQTDVGTISKFGLMELSRQRLRRANAPRFNIPCPLCGGSGKLKSTESFALLVLRVVHSVLAKSKYARVNLSIPSDTAAFLINRKRKHLFELEETFGARIELYPDNLLAPNQYHIDFLGDKNRFETNLPQTFDTKELLAHRERAAEVERAPYAGVSYESLADEEEPTSEVEVPDEPRDQENLSDQPKEPQAQGAEQAAGEGGGGKKRRRRRRKKKSGNAGTESQQPTEAKEPAVMEEASAAEPSATEQTGTEEDGRAKQPGPKKRSRRGRRKSKKPAGAEPSQESQTAPEPSPASEAAQNQVVEAGETADQPKKPARKRPSRRRRRKKTGTGQAAPASGEGGE